MEDNRYISTDQHKQITRIQNQKKISNNDRTIEIQALNSYYSYDMLVSTCSNLNIIQIEKNHTKTPRGMITKETFLF